MKTEIRVRSRGWRWRVVGMASALFVPARVAVTIGRTVYAYVDPLPENVLAHENIHVLQFQREGYRMWLKYVAFFLRDWVRYGSRGAAYRENPYEVEARRETRAA